MLLLETTINAVLHYVSTEYLALTHAWDGYAVSIMPPQWRTEYAYGGYCKLGFGSIEFSPDLFSDDWPPPVQITIDAYYTGTTEAAKELLFEASGYLREITREGVVYDLYGESLSNVIASGTNYNDTLTNLMSDWAAALGLAYDGSAGRAVSPAVVYTLGRDEILVNLMSACCAFFTHLFYVKAGTLYLADMLGDNGSRTITEFDYFPSRYFYEVPIAQSDAGGFYRESSYPYGSSLSLDAFHNVQGNIEAALDNVIAVNNKAKAALRIPLIGSQPAPGEKISWSDTSLGTDTDMYIRARTIQHDFDNEEFIVAGEGAISAS